MEDGKCRIVGKRRVLEAATCLLLPGTPVILATTVVDRKAGFVNYPFHENTCKFCEKCAEKGHLASSLSPSCSMKVDFGRSGVCADEKMGCGVCSCWLGLQHVTASCHALEDI